jgi:hypothetical protein
MPSFRRLRGFIVVSICLSAFIRLPAFAQNENETVGFQTNHLFESGQFGENIDILNGGLNLSTEDRAGQTLGNIQAGIEQGGRLGGGSLEVQVDASQWRYYANKFAKSGVAVYVDGVCYKNCRPGSTL